MRIIEAKKKIIDKSELKDKISSIVRQHLLTKGFEDSDVDEYFNVKIEEDRSDKQYPQLLIHVGAEIGYRSFEDLIDKLDPIVKPYDRTAYFEMETSGRAICVLDISNSSVVEEAYRSRDGYYGGLPAEPDSLEYGRAMSQFYRTSSTYFCIFDRNTDSYIGISDDEMYNDNTDWDHAMVFANKLAAQNWIDIAKDVDPDDAGDYVVKHASKKAVENQFNRFRKDYLY